MTDAYYFGPDRMSPRYEDTIDTHMEPDESYAAVSRRLTAAHKPNRPLFLKDLPYHLGPLLYNAETFLQYHGTIYIRDPAYTLPSLQRCWPDFTDWETGVESIYLVYRHYVERGGAHVVMDASDVFENPEGVIGRWCDAVGIERNAGALKWEPGKLPKWNTPEWESFYTTVSRTNGFERKPEEPPRKVDGAMARRIDALRPMYREMVVNKL